MNSNIKYTGTVTIKTLYKDKVLKEKTYHNTGCLPLFQYIAICLSGNANKYTNGLPTYLRLWRMTDESAVPFSSADIMVEKTYNAVPWSDTAVETSNDPVSASVSYTFLVSGANIDMTGAPVSVLAIYDVEHQAAPMLPSAWVKLEGDESLQGSNNATGISYLVIWTMTISNQTNQN